MFSKKYIIIFILGLFLLGGVFLIEESFQNFEPKQEPLEEEISQPSITEDTLTEDTLLPAQPETNILLDVPFTCQAPSAQWDNPIFQDGCEEAAILMAMAWLENKSLTKQEVEKEIKVITDFQEKTYGHTPDCSAADTVQLIKDYFGYQVEARSGISKEDIKAELFQGNLVIVPVNGRKMGNPYYTLPGPLRHMVVVIGYDIATKEFITNDPGTRHGQQYRYPENILEQALQDYLTGDHEPIIEINKSMIVVSPQSAN